MLRNSTASDAGRDLPANGRHAHAMVAVGPRASPGRVAQHARNLPAWCGKLVLLDRVEARVRRIAGVLSVGVTDNMLLDPIGNRG
jgi:hypothetical protein